MTQRVMCLSVRQPWAWLFALGYKNIENRTWHTRYRGPLLIHASKGLTHEEYRTCDRYASSLFVAIPPFDALERGGIVGMATLVDCVYQHDSPWFDGPVGWVLQDARPVPMVPCAGQLGLFEVSATVFSLVMKEAQQ